MKTYKFPDWNIEITPDRIEKNGSAGGDFINNVSQGSFSVDIVLIIDSTTINPDTRFNFNLRSPDTMPVNFSVEEIDIWITSTLTQYEIQ
jgi:hypothetical protein